MQHWWRAVERSKSYLIVWSVQLHDYRSNIYPLCKKHVQKNKIINCKYSQQFAANKTPTAIKQHDCTVIADSMFERSCKNEMKMLRQLLKQTRPTALQQRYKISHLRLYSPKITLLLQSYAWHFAETHATLSCRWYISFTQRCRLACGAPWRRADDDATAWFAMFWWWRHSTARDVLMMTSQLAEWHADDDLTSR